MSKRRIVCLLVLVTSITHSLIVGTIAHAQEATETSQAAEQPAAIGETAATVEPAEPTEPEEESIAPVPPESRAASKSETSPPAAEPSTAAEPEPDPVADPDEFAIDRKKNDLTPMGRAASDDENIDYDQIIRKVELSELPKPYRHPYLGAEGYRPNTLALSAGGRTPGVGLLFDYSFNRVGVGVSASYRSVEGFTVEKNNRELRGTGETYFNAWAHYNWIPFDVSPYFLLGMELAYNTEESFNVIAGVGVEGRFSKGWTVFVEYIRHETSKRGFPGAAIGYAF